MATGKVQIHSENILPIIKKWLYSEKDIFIRELVSNACDAIQKRIILVEKGEASGPFEKRIDITIDTQAKTLTFSDTGLGLTADETEKYLAQIAFSGAEEFIKAYELNDPFIGHFGLGFYSAFMVADSVEVRSLSYRADAKPVIWKSDGSHEYEIIDGSRENVGTDIILSLSKENEEYLEEKHLKDILKKYCSFLPYPIFLNGTQINAKDPLWLKRPQECTREEYLAFFRELYPFEEEPLFWIHLNVDYPFHVKGILYFPRIRKDFDPSKNNIKLFCNRVFVSDDCKDILPEYLTILKGALDSPDIPLNVSRSYLQVDKTVKQLASHISKKVTDTLSSLFKQEKERFIACWPDCEVVVKLGMLHDDKFFERSKEFLIWKTNHGTWKTTKEYLDEHSSKTRDTIFYAQDESQAPQLIELFKAKGIEILISTSALDAPVMALIERNDKAIHFKRIDAGIEDALLDPSKEKTLLDSEGKTEASRLADFFKAALSNEQVTVEAKSLASSDVSSFVILSEEERRLRDYLMRVSPDQDPKSIGKKTFVINTNSPIVSSIYELKNSNPSLAQEMIHHLFDLSLLAQKEMDPKSFNSFVGRSNKLLETVAKTVTGG